MNRHQRREAAVKARIAERAVGKIVREAGPNPEFSIVFDDFSDATGIRLCVGGRTVPGTSQIIPRKLNDDERRSMAETLFQSIQENAEIHALV